MKNPLLIPLLGIGSGMVMHKYVQFMPSEFWSILGAWLVLFLVARWRQARRASLICGFLGIVFLGAAIAEWRRPGEPPELNAESGESLIIEGCVVTPPVLSAVREQFVLEIAPGARTRVTVWLKDDEAGPKLRYGQRVEVAARIRKPRNFHNPGAFDFAGYLARQDIYWTASATGTQSVTMLPGKCGSAWLSPLYAIRTAALEKIDKLYGQSSYSAGLMRALLLGDATQVEKEWTEHFRRTGTYHALVVSGLHVTLVAGVLLFVWRLLGLPREWGLVISALGGWFYVLLCGWQSPALRAAAGFTLFTIARLVYRQGQVLNLLSAVALVFIIADPSQIFDPSFQLSFLSVAAIGAMATPLLDRTDGVERALSNAGRDSRLAPKLAQFRIEVRLMAETVSLWTRLPYRVALGLAAVALRAGMFIYGMAVVSAAVQLALLLPMVVYFHRASVTGVSANLLVVPLLSAAVPIGLFAVLTSWGFAAEVAAAFLDVSRRVADWHAVWEPSSRISDPPLWGAIMFILILLYVILAPRARRYSVALLALCAVFICWPTSRQADAGILELTAIDVGQGDSLLAGLPDGRWMLIDAGGIPAFRGRPKPRLDIGEDVITPYLLSRGITGLDVVVCTHAHEDHAGGLKAVIENFHPREIWGGANVPGKRGRSCQGKCSYGGVTLEVLAPTADYEPGRMPKNNDSLVLRLTHGDNVFLLTGDMERQVETALLKQGKLGRVDVLKVAHHGSKTSSTDEFIAATRPSIALISVGAGNLYRHPHPDVLDRLRDSHTAVFRTDRDGLTTIRSDGRRLSASTWRWTLRREGVNAVSSPLF